MLDRDHIIIMWLEAALLLLFMILYCPAGIQGQQAYNEPDQLGYLCNNQSSSSNASASTSCSTYVFYRARSTDVSLQLISDRFQVSREQIASASNISDSQPLDTNQLLLVPIPTCSCVSGRSQYNVSYVIQKGDTFYLVSTGTFEGLTTYQAVERANPSHNALTLQPGDKIIFPIRCACPTPKEESNGIQMLLTYPTVAGDMIQTVSKTWNLSTSDVLAANELTPQNSLLQINTTLLLPFKQVPHLNQSIHNSTSPPVPQPPSSPTPPAPVAGSSSGSSSSAGRIVGVVCGVVAAFMLVLLVLIWIIVKRRKLRRKDLQTALYEQASHHAAETEEGGAQTKKPKNAHLEGDLLAGMSDLVDVTDRLILYNFEELQGATQNFSASHLIQGSVYRGVARETPVAIKKMKGGMSQELKILCKVHHSNLVRLLGVCVNEDEHVFLVYELAENGSLSACLHKSAFAVDSSTDYSATSSSSAFLRWNMRLQIALDMATALEYIHDYTKPSFVHKDLKSSNVLLDGNFRAKLANFGMAKLTANTPSSPMLTKHIAGTQGYMAPEYLAHGQVTPKLDVYAFGVILLELLSGNEAILRPSTEDNLQLLPGREKFLSDEIGPILDSDQQMEKLRNWMDPVLHDGYPLDCALQVAILARACLSENPHGRPSMRDVTFTLSKLLQVSLEWEASSTLQSGDLREALEGR